MHTLRRWALSLLVLAACNEPVAPPLPLPDGAVAFVPNGELWRQLWRDVEACSGVKGSYAAVSWYVVPGGSSFLWQGQEVAGLWTSSGNRIVLAELSVARYDVVRHEMLHAVLEVDGHPAEYFVERCGAWIT